VHLGASRRCLATTAAQKEVGLPPRGCVCIPELSAPDRGPLPGPAVGGCNRSDGKKLRFTQRLIV